MRQQRIIDGLFQAIAVRNAGFSDVAIGSVAPALQLLFVIMMYIVRRFHASVEKRTKGLSCFTVGVPDCDLRSQHERLRGEIDGCVSFRADASSNARSFAEMSHLTGVFDEDFEEDPDDVEARYRTRSPAHFIGYHARKQLAFDLWWLALAIWLLCIIERGKINSGNWP